VAVINETAVREYFHGEDPIGKRFGFSIEQNSGYEIVGILRDTKYNNVRAAIPPTMYQPFPHETTQSASFQIRSAIEAGDIIPAIRAAVQRVDPTLPLGSIRTQNELVESGFTQERFFAMSYALFGGLALLIASIGLFGLMSYSVSRRTSEIGIRMALGAQTRHVLGMVISESLWMVGIGTLIGVGIALAAGRLVAAMLFGLSPTDGDRSRYRHNARCLLTCQLSSRTPSVESRSRGCITL
jgi:ABC-type antimicrobial peptide transport system permease subunit